MPRSSSYEYRQTVVKKLRKFMRFNPNADLGEVLRAALAEAREEVEKRHRRKERI